MISKILGFSFGFIGGIAHMGEVSLVIFLILFVIGYIMNIVEIFRDLQKPADGFHILRLIGIAVPPLGSMLGWIK